MYSWTYGIRWTQTTLLEDYIEIGKTEWNGRKNEIERTWRNKKKNLYQKQRTNFHLCVFSYNLEWNVTHECRAACIIWCSSRAASMYWALYRFYVCSCIFFFCHDRRRNAKPKSSQRALLIALQTFHTHKQSTTIAATINNRGQQCKQVVVGVCVYVCVFMSSLFQFLLSK